jgi:hypothetical protein
MVDGPGLVAGADVEQMRFFPDDGGLESPLEPTAHAAMATVEVAGIAMGDHMTEETRLVESRPTGHGASALQEQGMSIISQWV